MAKLWKISFLTPDLFSGGLWEFLLPVAWWATSSRDGGCWPPGEQGLSRGVAPLSSCRCFQVYLGTWQLPQHLASFLHGQWATVVAQRKASTIVFVVWYLPCAVLCIKCFVLFFFSQWWHVTPVLAARSLMLRYKSGASMHGYWLILLSLALRPVAGVLPLSVVCWWSAVCRFLPKAPNTVAKQVFPPARILP